MLHPDRYFDPNPAVREIARRLYSRVAHLPLICPHGHVDPRLLAEDEPFPDPAQLLVIPDHYIFRMLYSQGVRLEDLGIPREDGGPVENDPRKIWQRFADHYYLFAGTPTGAWLEHELSEVFGLHETPNRNNAAQLYDQISEKLAQPQFRPRALFDRFGIEVLCTTDAATDSLEFHRQIRNSGWNGRVLPTFRPDRLIDIHHPSWQAEIEKLSEVSGIEVSSFRTFTQALERRREFFREMGATATDHAMLKPFTHELSYHDADSIFQRAMEGQADESDNNMFTAHMLMEFARMSTDDGLVMQIHPGSCRDHNLWIFNRFRRDKGADIPIATEYTRNLSDLLNKYGNEPNFRLVLFTLDESTYSRELAPLAGHYPAVRLGPPWWFHDSIQGMTRFREQVTETAGFYNTAGFNDDTRAFLSIPARHDLCRRVDANFLANLTARHILTEEQAEQVIVDLSYNLAKETYRLGQEDANRKPA